MRYGDSLEFDVTDDVVITSRGLYITGQELNEFVARI